MTTTTTTTTTARLFAGVDVSKDRLDVCLRWSEPERHKEEAFVLAYHDSGIDALISRLLEEHTVLVIVEATGGFERTVVGAPAFIMSLAALFASFPSFPSAALALRP